MASATTKQAMLQKNPIIPPKIRSSENILTQSESFGEFPGEFTGGFHGDFRVYFRVSWPLCTSGFTNSALSQVHGAETHLRQLLYHFMSKVLDQVAGSLGVRDRDGDTINTVGLHRLQLLDNLRPVAG